jgi:hypothetical protein
MSAQDFITPNAWVRKKETPTISNLASFIKIREQGEGREEIKPKIFKRKKMIKIKAKVNEIQSNKTRKLQ